MIEYQLEATETLEAGKLQDNLLKAITGFKARSLCGRRIAPIEVMTRIEEVFVENGKLRAPTNHHLVRMGLSGPLHTELVERQFGLIRTLNPVIFNEEAVSMSYEPWEFFRGPNHELSKAHIVEGCFTVSAHRNFSRHRNLNDSDPLSRYRWIHEKNDWDPLSRSPPNLTAHQATSVTLRMLSADQSISHTS